MSGYNMELTKLVTMVILMKEIYAGVIRHTPVEQPSVEWYYNIYTPYGDGYIGFGSESRLTTSKIRSHLNDQWLFSKGPNFTDLERSIVSTKGVDDPFDVDHHSVNTRLALDGDSGHIVLKNCTHDEAAKFVVTSCFPSGNLRLKLKNTSNKLDGQFLSVSFVGEGLPLSFHLAADSGCDNGRSNKINYMQNPETELKIRRV